MAGDTLRGIGKKQIAEALESSSDSSTPAEAAEQSPAKAGSKASDAAAEIDIEEGRPVRSLDELPSDRTGRPANETTASLGISAAEVAANAAGSLSGLLEGAGAEGPAGAASALAANHSHVVPLGPSHTLLHAGSGAAAPAAVAADIAPVDDAVPLGSNHATRSGPNRVSFGTMIGHEMHAVQARVAAAIAEADSSARGTAHGRDVHLPARPGMVSEPSAGPLAAPGMSPMIEPASLSPAGAAPAVAGHGATEIREPTAAVDSNSNEQVNEFSGGDHTFFETLPINDEYEPENPRGRLYTRLAVSGAVVAVVGVVVVAWVNSHNNAEEPPPVELKTAAAPAPAPQPPPAHPVAAVPPRPVAALPPAPAPVAPARNNQPPPTSTIPSSMPEEPLAAAAPANAARVAGKAQPGAPPHEPKPAAVASSSPAAPKAAPAAKAPSIAPPAPVARDERKPAPAPAPAAERNAKPAVTAAAAEPAAKSEKKPTAIAAKPVEPAHEAAAKPREAPRAAAPAAPAPKAATAPVARAPHPETPARPVARPSAPATARAQKSGPAKGKGKYDPDGTLPLSFE